MLRMWMSSSPQPHTTLYRQHSRAATKQYNSSVKCCSNHHHSNISSIYQIETDMTTVLIIAAAAVRWMVQ